VVKGESLNLAEPIDIILCAGETEQTLMKEIQTKWGFELPTDPDKIHIDPKLSDPE
jgi:hypothetical protein